MPPKRKTTENTKSKMESSLLRDIELAEQAAERRLKAPELSVRDASRPRDKVILEQFAPECCLSDEDRANGKTHPEYHAYLGEEEQHRELVQNGYQPIVVDGQHKEYNGVYFYKIPWELYNREMKANKKSSDAMMKGKVDAEKKSASQKIGSQEVTKLEVSTVSGVTDANLSQARQALEVREGL